MNAHLFTSADGTRGKCDTCGKTRNAKAHKDAAAAELQITTEQQAEIDAAKALDAQVEADVAMEAEMDEECPQEDSPADLQAEYTDAVNAEAEAARIEAAKAEGAAALKAEADARVKPALEAIKAKVAAKKDIAALWVGWRITNAAVLADTTLAAKLKAAKPTADLDRTVRLTVAELQELDAIAAGFMLPGHTGPEIYSGRALRGRIAAAIAKIEEGTK